LALQKKIKIKGIAHITGGAYIDKIPRIIPSRLGVEIKKGSWPIPKIFRLIQKKGNVAEKEMYHVFNMGIGMVLVISPKDIKTAKDLLSQFRIGSWAIGKIVKASKNVRLI
jgi:phosphoribosylformylglycinamidine cyclo-ligase